MEIQMFYSSKSLHETNFMNFLFLSHLKELIGRSLMSIGILTDIKSKSYRMELNRNFFFFFFFFSTT